MNLSENFTEHELTYSETAKAHGIENKPDAKQLANAIRFANEILQPLRDYIGIPFLISSWFRSKELNRILNGSSPKSAHLSALAIDFTIKGKTAQETFEAVEKAIVVLNLDFDQLILEHNTKTGSQWVHMGYSLDKNREQVFKMTV